MFRLGGALVLIVVVASTACNQRKGGHPRAATQEPDGNVSSVGVLATPAGVQFARWLGAFNSGNRETLLAYHAQYFPYSAASADVSSIDREHGLSLRSSGFDEKQLEHNAPLALTVVLQERARPQFARVHLEVEPSPQHRVVSFEIGPIPTPLHFASQDELAQRNVDAARRQEVVQSLSRELEVHYVFADVAQRMSASLAQKLARGAYDNVSDAVEFAEILTRDLRQVSHDKHLQVRFGLQPPPPPTAAIGAAPPEWMFAQNFGFGETQKLPGDVALLTIDGFVPLLGRVVEEAIGARIGEVADAEALIIDLRSNRGGSPDTVALVASYFFEAKAMLLNTIQHRDPKQTRESWTKPELVGRRFGTTKPIYVLTSAQTFSGGEDLAYTLQAHKRAIVVGEITGGGAHPTAPRALDASLYVVVPWGRTVNSITNSNWEGTGVQPDILSASDQAVERALQHLQNRQQSQ